MILYLGLDPKHFARPCVHYPVIRTGKIGLMTPEVAQAWEECTHVIFTSQQAVSFWEHSCNGKIIVAIGTKTASLLKNPMIPLVETQEGLIELLKSMNLENPFFFWPRSKKARPCLTDFFTKRGWRYFAFDLYEPVFQKPQPVPNLDLFEEIVFTSPTTVHGFLHIFKTLPKDKKLTPIGPVTKEVLLSFL